MARNPASRYTPERMFRSLLIAAALALVWPAPLAAQNRQGPAAETFPAPPRPVPRRPVTRLEPAAEARAEYDRCLARAEREPDAAYEDAMGWARARGGGEPALHCAAIALYAQGRFRAAASAFTELAERTRDRRPVLRASLVSQAGHAWMIASEPGRALAAFDAAIGIAPEAAVFRLDRAEALTALGQDWEAIDELDRAVDLAPARGDVYALRAAAYRKVEALDLAAQDAARAVELAPRLADSWLERGIVNRLKGDKPAARRDFRQVLLLDPDGEAGDIARANIERMELETGPPVGRAPRR
jgi:tetratricopeptide (TPR) repeat protein